MAMNINKHIIKYLNYQYQLKNGHILTDNLFNIKYIKKDINQIFGYDVQFDILNDWLYKLFPDKIIKIKDSYDIWNENTYDANGNQLTYKDSDSDWSERTYDSNGNQLTYKNSYGSWNETTFDNNSNQLTYKDSTGCWFERTYDENGNQLTRKDSTENEY